MADPVDLNELTKAVLQFTRSLESYMEILHRRQALDRCRFRVNQRVATSGRYCGRWIVVQVSSYVWKFEAFWCVWVARLDVDGQPVSGKLARWDEIEFRTKLILPVR